MQILKDRIRRDGKIKAGNVLKVDSFLNHQMDIKLFGEIGKEFKRRFADAEVNKILTIEASGIGIACIVAQYFDVPVVFAKKTQTKNIAGEVYTTKVESFTHGRVYDIIVSKEFLGPGDKVLIIDDFLANGKALEGMEGVYVHRTPSRLPQVEQLKADLQKSGSVSPYSWEDDCYDFDKFYIGSDEKSQCRELFGRLKDMDVIDRGGGFYECVPRGHSKATAIDMVLKRCGISLDDAYVFGDSGNDLAMFRYGRNCVLMGNHSPVLEPYATFVTKTVEEDGIAYAMRELGII